MALGATTDQMLIRYVAESTYGTTPSDDAGWKTIPMTGETFNGQPVKVASEIIRPDRMEQDDIQVGLNVGGGFSSELQHSNLDDFIEATMMGTWTTNVVKIGTTNRSFTFEKELSDLTNQFISHTGMRANTMEISLQWGQPITITFDFLGNGIATPASSLVGLGSTTAYTSKTSMDGAGGVTSIKLDTAEFTTDYMQSFTLRVDNSMTPDTACKFDAPVDISAGKAIVTGSIGLYVPDLDFLDKVIANTAAEFEVITSDGTNTFTFNLPNIKFGDGAINAGGGGGSASIIQNLTYRGLYDATDTTSLTITRSS